MDKKNFRFSHFFVVNVIRIILLVTLFYAFKSNRVLIEVVCIIGFFVTFLPTIFRRVFKLNLPVSFEILYLMVIYGILLFGEVRGLYSGLAWWDIAITFTASIVLGFASLSIVYVFYKYLNIRRNFMFAGFLIFCFTVTFGVLWEVLEFTLDLFLHTGLQKGLADTMQDVIINIFGALTVSIVGAINISRGQNALVSTFFSGFMEDNIASIFGKKRSVKSEIFGLIKEGESEQLEFKSSIRTNLHTGEFDKKMEQNILKTVVAFLNTKGGNLLVGVSDSGEILGLEKDSFQNRDKTGLHLTNLIKSHIGNEFLPFIRFRIVNINGKDVVLISCEKSKKRVFLRGFGVEEFYIRNGPASVKLEGNSLIDYIEHKFGRRW